MIELRRYVDGRGKDVFWRMVFASERSPCQSEDSYSPGSSRTRKVWRLQALREGLCELRIDWGPGYRVYYTMLGKACVLLLGGGDKKQQSADIERAPACMKDYKEGLRDNETQNK